MILGCAAVCLGVCMPLYLRYKPLRPGLAASFRTLGTVCALVPALVGALRLDAVCWLFVAALGLQAVSDFLMEEKTSPGMGISLLGLVCYTVAFLKIYPLGAAHLVLTVCFLAGLFAFLYRQKTRLGKSAMPLGAYGTVLCVMAAAGIAGGAASATLKGMMIALGTALYFFSDYLRFHAQLHTKQKKPEILILVTCFAAQLLLGGSCLF